MAEITLKAPGQHPLRPLVEAALHNERRILEGGIRRTEERLLAFEARFGMSTTDFLQRSEDDKLEESLEFTEWEGEHRLLVRLREKAEILNNIHIAN